MIKVDTHSGYSPHVGGGVRKDAQGLAAFRKKVGKDDELAVEASQNVYSFYEQGQPYGKQGQLVDAHRFAVVAKSKKKPDRHDTILLVRFLKLGWVPRETLLARLLPFFKGDKLPFLNRSS